MNNSAYHSENPPSTSQSLGSASSPPPRPPVYYHPSGFPFALIMKILVGLMIFIAVLYFIFRFLLPYALNGNQGLTVKLTYWGLWESPEVMKPIIEEFERANPSIKVQYSRQDIKQYKDRLLVRTQNGTGPDIFRFHNTWVGMLSGILLPLPSDVIGATEFKALYYPVIQKDLVRLGGIYGLPLTIDTLSLFVNTEIFQAAGAQVPATWDDFVNVSRTLVVKDASTIKTAGAAIGTMDNVTHAPDIVAMLLIQNGADLADLAKTSQNASEAFAFYTSFANGQDSVWDSRLDQSMLAFASGNVAMYFGYSQDVFTIKTLNPKLQFSVHPVPSLPGKKITVASYWVEGISAKSSHQKEAALFMQFLARRDIQEKLFAQQAKSRPAGAQFGEPYARRDLGTTLKDTPLAYPFVSQAETAVSTYFVGETYDGSGSNPGINARMNQYLINAVNASSRSSSDESIKALTQGMAEVLKQYGQ